MSSTGTLIRTILAAVCLIGPFQISFASLVSGTGFFVSSDGYLLTNAHVVEDGRRFLVRMHGKAETIQARLISVDSSNDLALLKVEESSRPLTLVSTNLVDKGARVFTLGFPNPEIQGVEAKYTEGVISSFSGLGNDPTTLQVTTPIQSGNSGGPLFTSDGKVVGIVVSKLSAISMLKAKKGLPEAVNYAVKADYAIPFLRQIPSESLPKDAPQKPKVRTLEQSVVLVMVERAEKADQPRKGSAPDTRVSEKPRFASLAAGMFSSRLGGVPVQLDFERPLGIGETFEIEVTTERGIERALKGTVKQGYLKGIRVRVRVPGTGSILATCSGCSQTSVRTSGSSEVAFNHVKNSLPQTPKLWSTGLWTSVVIAGEYSGETALNLTGGAVSVSFDLGPALSRNPDFGFNFETSGDSQTCVSISNGRGFNRMCM